MWPYPHVNDRSRCSCSTSAHGIAKYVHHVAKMRPMPAKATTAASTVQPSEPCTTALIDATVPMTPSPSVMITSSPYRSAM